VTVRPTERGAVTAGTILFHAGQRDRAAAAAQSSTREDVHEDVDVQQGRLRQRSRQFTGALPRREAASS